MRDKFLRKAAAIACAGLVFGALIANASTQAQTANVTPALYQRLGGYDALAAVADDFLGGLAADRQLARFFVGVSADSLRKLRQHVVDQLCEASGGPCNYFGRSMRTAHAGLGITESDWQLTVKHLTATFDKFKVPDKERSELVALLASLKADIVEK